MCEKLAHSLGFGGFEIIKKIEADFMFKNYRFI